MARLDRLAERAEVNDALTQLDDQIEALQRGESLREALAEDALEISEQDPVPCVPSSPSSCSEAVGRTKTLSQNLPSLGERLEAMDAARPHGALLPHQLGDADEVESLQLEAFEAGEPEWWLVKSWEELEGL